MPARRGVFVTGTDTGVGKTYLGAAVIRRLVARGVTVLPRKPVESGCKTTPNGELVPADATTLYIAAGRPGTLNEVCPYPFRQPLSPAQAARLDGVWLSTTQLEHACLDDRQEDQFLWVEGAGGFYSPIASDGLNAHLAERLGLPILLVAADRLGCINHVLLTVEAIYARRLNLLALVLNQTALDKAVPAMANAEDLRRRLECAVFSIGYRQASNAAPAELVSLSELLV